MPQETNQTGGIYGHPPYLIPGLGLGTFVNTPPANHEVACSSRPRIEMGGPRCQMFSHGPMSGARGGKGLLGYIFSCTRGAKLGPGGRGSRGPLDPLLGCKVSLRYGFFFFQEINGRC